MTLLRGQSRNRETFDCRHNSPLIIERRNNHTLETRSAKDFHASDLFRDEHRCPVHDRFCGHIAERFKMRWYDEEVNGSVEPAEVLLTHRLTPLHGLRNAELFIPVR